MLRIDVIIDEIYEIKEKAKMILFRGTAESDFFHGTILPGGVDTQRKDESGDWALSARYIIDGFDDQGNVTKLFVENNGKEVDGKMVTCPTILTDNPRLDWLEQMPLEGSVEGSPEGVTIKIYKKGSIG